MLIVNYFSLQKELSRVLHIWQDEFQSAEPMCMNVLRSFPDSGFGTNSMLHR